MSPLPIQLFRTSAERKRAAPVATGVAPNQFGRCNPAQPLCGRTTEAVRGERKHPRPWRSSASARPTA